MNVEYVGSMGRRNKKRFRFRYGCKLGPKHNYSDPIMDPPPPPEAMDSEDSSIDSFPMNEE